MSVNLTQAVLQPYKCDPGSEVPSAIYMKLTPEALAAIVEGNGYGVKFHFGDKWELKVGDQSFGATNIPEASHVDLFRKNSGTTSSASYQHVGKVSHRVTIRRSINDTAASSKLRSQNDVLLKEKESHRAILLNGVGSDTKAIKRPNSAAGIRRPLGPSSPALAGTSAGKAASTINKSAEGSRSLPTSPSAFGGSPSPNLPAYTSSASSSASSSSAPSTKSLASMTTSKKPLSSMTLLSGTMRVLHLLALGPNGVSSIASRTHLPASEVQSILSEHGKELAGTDSQYTLADNRYKDLRVWEWKHYSNGERTKVIQDSIDAFDRLNYPSDHVARRNIIEPKLRQSKINESSTVTTTTAAAAAISTTATIATAITTLNGDPNKNITAPSTKKIVGAILKSNKTSKKLASGTSTPRIATSSPSPTRNGISTNKKVKSAEYIRDSDEEAADYEMVTNSSMHSSHNTPRSGTPAGNASTPRPTPASPALKIQQNSSSISTNGIGANGAHVKRKAAASGISIPSTSETKVRKVARTSTPSSSKLQQPTSEEDMFKLARKFKDTYSEYAKLYSVLSTRGKRPKSDIQRLLSMHRDLETWKQLLWASSPKMKKTST